MTERLSALIHDEVTDLDIPRPEPVAILRQGRRLRRRRRAGSVVAATVTVAVVAGSFTLLHGDQGRGGDAVPPATAPVSADSGAYAVGSTVWPRGPEGAGVEVDGKVKALYYTSEGVLARYGETPWTDDPGPSRYAAFDGAAQGAAAGGRDLGVDLGDRVPGTDAGQPFLAYAEDASATDDDRWDVVVLDVRDGSEAARVPVDGAFTWAGWEAPPVALSGDHVYVGLDATTADVDWRSGEVSRATQLGGSTMPTVWGGRTVTYDRTGGAAVVDVQTGEELLRVPGKQAPYVSLSPDGRYAKVVLQTSRRSEASFTLHDLDGSRERSVDGAPWDFGWTTSGNLLRVSKGEVTVCAAFGDDACVSEPVDLGKGEVKLAGLLYES